MWPIKSLHTLARSLTRNILNRPETGEVAQDPASQPVVVHFTSHTCQFAHKRALRRVRACVRAHMFVVAFVNGLKNA